MIFGLMPEDGTEPEAKGLTETEFRQMLGERYGQSPAQVEEAVRACKGANG